MPSTAPAPPSRCPIMDLVELTGISRALGPSAASSEAVSDASLNGVPVPWALTYPTLSGGTPASWSARRTASAALVPAGSGRVMWNASLVSP
ncbi:MAG: hypothetical protein H6Q87_163 [candidate division NC10 bacterium]|nr:hypothetical protein [candidate division NC10 bacterium]